MWPEVVFIECRRQQEKKKNKLHVDVVHGFQGGTYPPDGFWPSPGRVGSVYLTDCCCGSRGDLLSE